MDYCDDTNRKAASHFEYVANSVADIKKVSLVDLIKQKRSIQGTKPWSDVKSTITKQDSDEIKQKALQFMEQLAGWCSKEKASVLVDIVLKCQPQTVVEIGVFGGKSFIPMAAAMKALGKGVAYGIDPWDANASIAEVKNEANKSFWGWIDYNQLLLGLMDKIKEFDLQDYIVLIKSTSEDADPISDIDILHVDGNHCEKTSYLDVTKWGPLVKSGGWVILDDIRWSEEGLYTEARAVEWLNTHFIKLAEFSEQSGWGIWFKP